MNTFILDASVAAKWLFEEEDSAQAVSLMELFEEKRIKILVPEIFYSELANTCWKKVKQGSSTIERAVEILDRIMELPFERCSGYELSDVGLENALRFNISVYDGLYLALAEIYLAPLVTADQKLLEACQKRFDFIESLRNLKLE